MGTTWVWDSQWWPSNTDKHTYKHRFTMRNKTNMTLTATINFTGTWEALTDCRLLFTHSNPRARQAWSSASLGKTHNDVVQASVERLVREVLLNFCYCFHLKNFGSRNRRVIICYVLSTPISNSYYFATRAYTKLTASIESLQTCKIISSSLLDFWLSMLQTKWTFSCKYNITHLILLS